MTRCGRLFLALLALGACPQAGHAHGSISNRELVELTDINGLAMSSDGRFAAFRTEQADVARNSYILRWHSIDLETGVVRDIGSGGEPMPLDPGALEPGRAIFLPDGRTIVFRALIDGAIGLWRADVAGERTEPLVIRDADIEDFSLTQDGRAILFTVGPSRAEIIRAETQDYDRGILADASVDLSQNLFRGGSVSGRMASQRLVGFWFIRGGLLWRSPRQQHRLDLASGADVAVGRPIMPDAVTVASTPPPLEVRNVAGDVATASWDGEKGSLKATFADGSVVACNDPICVQVHIASLLWRLGMHEVIVDTVDRQRHQSIYRWDLTSNRMTLVNAAPGLLSGGRRYMIPCAASTKDLICIAASPASPPELVRLDLGSGNRRTLFDPNGSIRAVYRPETQAISWKFDGGREATGVLMLPPGKHLGPAPLYLNYYLCEGFLRGGEGDEWPIPKLLEAGFAVACVNSVPNPGPQDAVADNEIALSAIRALVAKLSRDGTVNPRRVAMGGFSHGSEIAMWIATHSDLLAAVSIASGQLEPVNFWTGSMPGSDQPSIYRRVWKLGAPDETAAQWKRVSSALNVRSITSPILFQLPEQEARRIPELYGRLVRRGIPTELYVYPDEDHIKVQPRHRLAVYDRNLDWFRYWLQDYRDPDPAKAAQYQRWNRLRQTAKTVTSSRPGATTRAQPIR